MALTAPPTLALTKRPLADAYGVPGEDAVVALAVEVAASVDEDVAVQSVRLAFDTAVTMNNIGVRIVQDQNADGLPGAQEPIIGELGNADVNEGTITFATNAVALRGVPQNWIVVLGAATQGRGSGCGAALPQALSFLLFWGLPRRRRRSQRGRLFYVIAALALAAACTSRAGFQGNVAIQLDPQDVVAQGLYSQIPAVVSGNAAIGPRVLR